MQNMEKKYIVLLTFILGLIAVYGIVTMQILMAVFLITAILWLAVVFQYGLSLNARTRRIVSLLIVGLAITLYSFFTSEWLVWCVVTTLIVADCEIHEFRDWMDARQERYLAALKGINAERCRE